MQQALRSSALTGVVVLGAGLVAFTPVVTPIPDIQVRSSDVQLVSAADAAATSLGGLIDAGLQQAQTYIDDTGIAVGYLEYGVLSELSSGLDSIGATSLGTEVMTLADDAISTQWTAGVGDLFADLEALVNALGLNSIPLGGAATADAAAALAADATTLGGLVDSGLQEVETLVLDSGIALGYAEYGLLSELATGLDDAGATALGADVMTLADDAIGTQWTVGVTDLFNGLETLVADLGLNSIPI